MSNPTSDTVSLDGAIVESESKEITMTFAVVTLAGGKTLEFPIYWTGLSTDNPNANPDQPARRHFVVAPNESQISVPDGFLVDSYNGFYSEVRTIQVSEELHGKIVAGAEEFNAMVAENNEGRTVESQ